MLNINVTIEGDKVIISGLQHFAREMPGAINRGLESVAKGVHHEAFNNLSGPGRSRTRIFTKKQDYYKTGDRQGKRKRQSSRGRTDSLGAAPGSYPIPVLTGNLRRLLNWLKPGATKSSNGNTYSAGQFEAMVYNSAAYARVAHEGELTHETHGRRPYIDDGLEAFNQGDRIRRTLEVEIMKTRLSRGIESIS